MQTSNRAAAGLTEKLKVADRLPRQLPVTFDADATRGPDDSRRDDVVLAHLNHPLIAMSTRLLRAAVSSSDVGLHRVIGRTEARNVGSARTLEKLGMRREAHLVENEWVRGEWQSELVYAILDREWRAGADGVAETPPGGPA